MAENPVVSKRHICGQLSPHDVTPLLSHIFGGLAPTYLSINFVRGTRLGELAQRRYTMAEHTSSEILHQEHSKSIDPDVLQATTTAQVLLDDVRPPSLPSPDDNGAGISREPVSSRVAESASSGTNLILYQGQSV